MPAAPPRAALAAVAGPSSASSMAGLTSSMGSLQLARSTRSARSFSHTHNVSYISSSSLPSTSSSSVTTSARQPSTLTSCCRRPVLPSSASSSSRPAQAHAQAQAASFSTTSPMNRNLKRIKMRAFFKTAGRSLRRFDPAAPLHSGDNFAKFPYNPTFKVQPILSDETRLRIWQRVVQNGEPVKAVAADYDIDMRRVAACVRLKELERSWILQGKPLAMPYANAIRKMIATVPLEAHENGMSFEPTNEISVHPYTQQQLFLPVSESRHFTRKDAAKAFHPTMLPADKRMPIPQLVNVEKNAEAASGGKSYDRAAKIFREEVAEEQRNLAKREQEAVAAEEARTAKIESGRFQYRIRDYNSEQVGKTGRAGAVGWRYGAPHNDRKRGLLKIPASIG